MLLFSAKQRYHCKKSPNILLSMTTDAIMLIEFLQKFPKKYPNCTRFVRNCASCCQLVCDTSLLMLARSISLRRLARILLHCGTSWPPQEKLFIWSLFFQYNRRIQLAPHARRRAVPKTVSGWIPVVRLTSDEVAKSGRTGIMTAYTENMLSRKRTLWTA